MLVDLKCSNLVCRYFIFKELPVRLYNEGIMVSVTARSSSGHTWTAVWRRNDSKNIWLEVLIAVLSPALINHVIKLLFCLIFGRDLLWRSWGVLQTGLYIVRSVGPSYWCKTSNNIETYQNSNPTKTSVESALEKSL